MYLTCLQLWQVTFLGGFSRNLTNGLTTKAPINIQRKASIIDPPHKSSGAGSRTLLALLV